MIEYDVGVSLATRHDVKRVDLDYFASDDEPSPVSDEPSRT
jgi:hypothetical protein